MPFSHPRANYPFRTASLLGLLFAAATQTPPATAQGGELPDPSRGYLVDISADWCKPCQQMKPAIERLIARNYPVRMVNIDHNPQLRDKYDIRGLPTLLLIVDNKVVARAEGRRSESELLAMLDRIPKRSESDASAATATQLASTPPARRRRASDSLVVRGKASDPQPLPAEAIGPMASSVRLRIDEDGLVNYGSGTIVSSKPGRTVIATCGHLFRDMEPGVSVEVDFFRNGQPVRTLGRCLAFNLKSDVGLVEVPTESTWPSAPVATTTQAPGDDESVVSIGCSGGADPTAEATRITCLNRYQGPDNIEVDRMPCKGRSGGGLFDRTGRLIGVCIGELVESERGLYAGLAALHDLLDEASLGELYEDQSLLMADRDASPHQTVEIDVPPAADWPKSSQPAAGRAGQIATTSQVQPSTGPTGDGDTEIVCIIRSKSDPKGTSRVVIIDRADAELLERLEGPTTR